MQCIGSWGHPSHSPFPTPCQVWSGWTYSLPYYSVFLLLIHYFTLWPFTFELWTHAVYRLWRDETRYQMWTQSSNSRRSYCDFSIWPNDFERRVTCCAGSEIIFTKFDRRHLIRAWLIALWCWYVMSRCDLDLLTLNLYKLFSPSSLSPLSSSLTHSVFHSDLRTWLFCKSFPP